MVRLLMPIRRRLRERIAVGASSTSAGGGRTSPGVQAGRGRMRSRDARAGRGRQRLLLVLLSVRGRGWWRGGRPRVRVEIAASPRAADLPALASDRCRCCSQRATRRKFAASHCCRRTGAAHGIVPVRWSGSDSSRKIRRSGGEVEPVGMAGKQTTTTNWRLLPPLRCRSKRTKPRERRAGDLHSSPDRLIEDETTTRRRKKKKEARLTESEEEGCCSRRTSCGGCGANRTRTNRQDRHQSASRTIHTRRRNRIAPSKLTGEEAAAVPSASGDN